MPDTNHAVKEWTPVTGDYHALTARGIKEETCRKWQYQLGPLRDGTPAHIMNIRGDNGELIAQKFRTKDEKGLWQGDAKNPPFYGQWLWNKGKHLVITEGEIDAMSVSQAMDLKWPVVSLPNGAQSVEKVIKRSYDWLMGFDNIVLMFDMDEPGREAVEVACSMLPAGRVKVATLPRKDANEVLMHEGPGALTRAFWDAKPWTPEGIVAGSEFTLERLKTARVAGFPYRYPTLQEMTAGLRKGEITMLTAGTGIGKSTLARELAYDLHQGHGLTIGNVYLEENNTKTAQGYIALHAGVPLGRLRQDPSIVSDDEWQKALQEVIQRRMFFYDHFGSLEAKNLIAKLHYLAKVQKVDFIVLDHISIITSGMESSSEGERKDIDILMTRLRSLVEETGVGVIGIAHLKRSQGKDFNEGSQVSLSDFRGSAAIEQLSDNVIALERNQQAKGDKSTTARIRILKCRETGETGAADMLKYDRSIGRNVLAPEGTVIDMSEGEPERL